MSVKNNSSPGPSVFRCVFFETALIRERTENIASFFNIVQIYVSKQGLFLVTSHCADALIYWHIPADQCKELQIADSFMDPANPVRFQLNVKALFEKIKLCKKSTHFLIAFHQKSKDSLTIEFVNPATGNLEMDSETVPILFQPRLDDIHRFADGESLPEPQHASLITLPASDFKKLLATCGKGGDNVQMLLTRDQLCMVAKGHPCSMVVPIFHHKPTSGVTIEPHPSIFQPTDHTNNSKSEPYLLQTFSQYYLSLIYKYKSSQSINSISFAMTPNKSVIVFLEGESTSNHLLYYIAPID